MSADYFTVEQIARDLCEAKHGPESWDTKRRKRNAYRKQAMREIERGRGLATLDALLSVFGFKRVAK